MCARQSFSRVFRPAVIAGSCRCINNHRTAETTRWNRRPLHAVRDAVCLCKRATPTPTSGRNERRKDWRIHEPTREAKERERGDEAEDAKRRSRRWILLHDLGHRRNSICTHNPIAILCNRRTFPNSNRIGCAPYFYRCPRRGANSSRSASDLIRRIETEQFARVDSRCLSHRHVGDNFLGCSEA